MNDSLKNLNPIFPALFASVMTIRFINHNEIRITTIGGIIVSILVFAISVVGFLFMMMAPYYFGILK